MPVTFQNAEMDRRLKAEALAKSAHAEAERAKMDEARKKAEMLAKAKEVSAHLLFCLFLVDFGFYSFLSLRSMRRDAVRVLSVRSAPCRRTLRSAIPVRLGTTW